MNKIITEDIYKIIDKERIKSALDNGNLNEATILLKYSSLSRQEFDNILLNHPSANKRSYDDIWVQILDLISIKVSVPQYNTWFVHTNGIINEDTLIVFCKNEFQRYFLVDQYQEFIEATVEEVTGIKYRVIFETE